MNSKPVCRKPIFDNIPPSLKVLIQWVVWLLEYRNGKWTKPPIDPKTGRRASINKPETWSDFETAVTAYQSGKFEGIGLVLLKDNGLVGFDFDHCVNPSTSEIINAEVKEYLSTLGTYTEFSPIDGIRALAFGTLPENHRKKLPEKGYEVYAKDRYLTITGHRLNTI